MIDKLLEAFFRRWLLVMLPLIVTVIGAAAYILAIPPQFEAQASIWVERPTYLQYSSTDLNQYLTPAQSQRSRLAELMQTRSFRGDIVAKTPLAPIAQRPNGDEVIAQIFGRDFDGAATGEHLLVLRFRAEDRALAADVLTATIAAFRDRSSADRLAQAGLAITFYENQLAQGEAKLRSARTDAAVYLSAHQGLAQALVRGGTDATRTDPQFAELQRQVDSAQADADAARRSLDRARLDISAGTQGGELTFRVTDPPQVSLTASRPLRRTLLYPALAMVGGLVMSAGIAVLLAVSDRSIRSLADVAPEIVILGVVPRLVARAGSRQKTGAIRRSVAAVAGAVASVRRTPSAKLGGQVR